MAGQPGVGWSWQGPHSCAWGGWAGAGAASPPSAGTRIVSASCQVSVWCARYASCEEKLTACVPESVENRSGIRKLLWFRLRKMLVQY